MNKQNDAELATDLMRARIRLTMIARMARVGMENNDHDSELIELMQTILATCGLEEPTVVH